MADETPLLDQIVAEGRIADPNNMSAADIDTYIREHNARAERNPICRWEPCTYILFGQHGESHEDYHKRKGTC